MSNPAGTDWVGPGMGATVRELFERVGPNMSRVKVSEHLLDLLDPLDLGASWQKRTNLKLTGRPFVEYDYERISACNVEEHRCPDTHCCGRKTQ